MSHQLQAEVEKPRELNASHAQRDLVNLLDITPAAIVVVGSDQRIRLTNPAAQSLLGLRDSDLGQELRLIFAGSSWSDVASCLGEVIADARSREVELEDTAGRIHLVRIKPYWTADNQPEGAVLAFQDIHELRSAQANAEHAHVMTDSLFGTVETPLVLLREDLRVKLVNDAFHHHFGTQPADLEEQLFLELQHNRFDLAGIRDALARILEEQTPVESFEIQEQSSGSTKHVSITVRLIKPATEKMLLLALNDITARKEAETLLLLEHQRLKDKVEAGNEELELARRQAQVALQESRIELLRSREELRHLTASLLHAQDEERRRVSRELHDDLSQRVAKLQFEIEVLEQNVPFTDLDDAREKLRTVRDQAASLAEDLRRVAYRLHPSVLDHLGLGVALRAYVNEFTRSTQIHVDLSIDGIPRDLPNQIASCAYRIAQEALRNVSKHAQAERVEMILRIEGSFLTLLIRDEGVGFDLPSARPQGGLGLIGIEERVRLVGGSVSFETAPGCGTSVRVRLPLQLPS